MVTIPKTFCPPISPNTNKKEIENLKDQIENLKAQKMSTLPTQIIKLMKTVIRNSQIYSPI